MDPEWYQFQLEDGTFVVDRMAGDFFTTSSGSSFTSYSYMNCNMLRSKFLANTSYQGCLGYYTTDDDRHSSGNNPSSDGFVYDNRGMKAVCAPELPSSTYVMEPTNTFLSSYG